MSFDSLVMLCLKICCWDHRDQSWTCPYLWPGPLPLLFQEGAQKMCCLSCQTGLCRRPSSPCWQRLILRSGCALITLLTGFLSGKQMAFSASSTNCEETDSLAARFCGHLESECFRCSSVSLQTCMTHPFHCSWLRQLTLSKAASRENSCD